MEFLFWRVERASAGSARTRVRIELKRDPDSYTYQWSVADKRKRRLSKRELHELDMRVAKYVATLNEMPPQKPEEQTLYTTL